MFMNSIVPIFENKNDIESEAEVKIILISDDEDDFDQ